jgi:putative flippase GtrA
MFLRNRAGAGFSTRETLLSFLRYFVSGVAALSVHLSVLILLVEGFAAAKPLASTVGLLVCLPVNYLLQHFYVFRAKGRILTNFSKYLALTAVTAALNAVLMWLMTTRTSIPYPVAQIMITAIIFVINFLGNRAFTFGGKSLVLRRPEEIQA